MKNFKKMRLILTTIIAAITILSLRAQEVKPAAGNFVKQRVDTAQVRINAFSEEDMYRYDNIWYIYNNTNSSKDRGFAFLRDNAEEIAKANKEMETQYSEGKVLTIIIAEAIAPFEKSSNGKADWKKIKQNLLRFGDFGLKALRIEQPKLFFKDEIKPLLDKGAAWPTVSAKIKSLKMDMTKEFLFGSVNVFYLNKVSSDNTKDITSLVKALNYYLAVYPDKLSAEILNSWAWLGFEKFTAKADLLAAASWAKIGVEKGPQLPNIHDTYANLLYRLGHNAEALIWQAKAVKLAPDDQEIKANYEKMKAGQKN